MNIAIALSKMCLLDCEYTSRKLDFPLLGIDEDWSRIDVRVQYIALMSIEHEPSYSLCNPKALE